MYQDKVPSLTVHLFQLEAPTTSAPTRCGRVSFLSPPVQSYAELPSFSSTTTSLPYLPSADSNDPDHLGGTRRPGLSLSKIRPSLSLSCKSLSPAQSSPCSSSNISDSQLLLRHSTYRPVSHRSSLYRPKVRKGEYPNNTYRTAAVHIRLMST